MWKIERGYIYYIKEGTVQKRGHIYYIKEGTTKYVPYRAQKRAQRRAHLLNIYERERGGTFII